MAPVPVAPLSRRVVSEQLDAGRSCVGQRGLAPHLASPECAERAGQATDDGYRIYLHHDIENPPCGRDRVHK